jgi:hypothetical protein
MTERHNQHEHLPELQQMLATMVLGHASDQQLDRVNELLTADLELRRYASRFLEEESALRRQFEMLGLLADFHTPSDNLIAFPGTPQLVSDIEQHETIKAVQSLRRIIGRNSFPAVLIAASLLIVLGTTLFWPLARNRPSMPADNVTAVRQSVGRMFASQAPEASSERPLAGAKDIHVGDVITVDSGVTKLRFDCGASVFLVGRAELEIVSPMRAALRRGTLTAHVDESAHGFRIDTPNSKVIDLGTEFGLTVHQKGVTDMVVFSGKIAMEYTQVPSEDSQSSSDLDPGPAAPLPIEGRLLSEGEAITLSQTGELRRLVAVHASDYPRHADLRKEPADWPPVIESVADNLREGEANMCYQIVHHGFGEDARAYVDRAYEWNGLLPEFGLPRCLRNADYIMPFCDDKLNSQIEMRVTLSRPARLYVLFDEGVEPPAWLTSKFRDTGYHVGVDEGARADSAYSLGVGPGVSVDRCMSVWSCDVPQAGTVVLGSMKSSVPTSLMYGVAAVPLDIAERIAAEPLVNYTPRIGDGFLRAYLLPKPLARARTERVASFRNLTVATPSDNDAASASRGIHFRIESVHGTLPIHPGVRVDGDTLPALNDGLIHRNSDDRERCAWYNGQGRFSVDLLRPEPIQAINVFSCHRDVRAPQFYSLWGSAAEQQPSPDFQRADEAVAVGWQLIAWVDTRNLGIGGVHASSVSAAPKTVGPFRHLLWIAERQVRGTFFDEIDVHVAPTNEPLKALK